MMVHLEEIKRLIFCFEITSGLYQKKKIISGPVSKHECTSMYTDETDAGMPVFSHI